MPSQIVIAVTHADGPLGARVVARLGDPDAAGGAAAEPRARIVGVAGDEVESTDLKRTLHGSDVVVLLAAAEEAPLAGARRVLEAAADAAVGHVVVVSSALVYGAWPTNPVPLTEAAPLRPNPDFPPAVELGEVERLVAEWRDAHPSATVTVLRPAVPVAEDAPGWLAPMLGAVRGVPVGDDDAPAQFVHLDDVAAAVATVVEARFDGVANVAPDGWIEGEELRALAGGPRVRLPGRLAERVTRLRWRAGISPTPPGLLPWTVHPWVVAADVLKGLGWEPTSTNEEAFVAGHRPMPWATVSPRRRQELTLGVSALAIVGAAAGAVLGVRKLRRRA